MFIFCVLVVTTTLLSRVAAFHSSYLSPTQLWRFSSALKFPYGNQKLNLDADDILDDDVELLVSLRRQMENNFNASPREMTNRIKDFFSPKRKTRDDTTTFKSYIVSNTAVMDAVNVILLVEGCNRNRINLEELTTWSALLDAMEKPSALFTSSMIYRGISCLKFLNMRDPSARQYLKLLWERIEESNVLLGPQDICPAIYSMQSLDSQLDDARSILDYLSKSMAAISGPIAAKPMCSAIYGLKKQKPTVEVRRLMWEMANRIQSGDTYYHSVNVCIALNGFQSMDDCYPEVRRLLDVLLDKAIDADEQGFDMAEDREISMALFGLQKMGCRSRGMRGRNAPYRAQQYTSSSPPPAGTGALARRPLREEEEKKAPADHTIMSSFVPGVDAHFTEVVEEFIAAGGSSAGVEADEANLIKYTSFGSTFGKDKNKKRVYLTPQNSQKEDPDSEDPRKRSTTSSGKFKSNRLSDDFTPELQRVLHYVISLMQHFEKPFEAKRLGFAMLGLSRLNADLPEVSILLEELTKKAQSAWGDVNGQELSMILHGLVGLQSDNPQVRSLLSNLVPLVRRCPSMASSDARSALFGLQGMHSGSSREAENLFDALGDLLERSNIQFRSPMDLSNSLYGLQGLANNSPATKKILKNVLQMAASIDPERTFNGRDAAMSLYGLRGANGQTRETLDILSVLTPFIENCRGPLNANDIATCLYGLQNFKSNQKEVKKVLKALNRHVTSKARGRFNPKGLSMVLNGLQGFDSRRPEVRELIKGITVIARRTAETFYGFEDFHQLSSALYGLRDLSSDSVEVRELLVVIADILKNFKTRGANYPNTRRSSATTASAADAKAWVKKDVVVTPDSNINSWTSAASATTESVGGSSASVQPATTSTTAAVGAVGAAVAVNATPAATSTIGHRVGAGMQVLETPKADKVAMALYGLQKMDPSLVSVNSILEVLGEYVAAMPPPNGVATGMALRAFREYSGLPTPAQRTILFRLAEKLPGWSTRKITRSRGSVNRARPPQASDVQATVRSSLSGIANLDRTDEAVRVILGAFASELLSDTFDLKLLDYTTYKVVSQTYETIPLIWGDGDGHDEEKAYFLQRNEKMIPALREALQEMRLAKWSPSNPSRQSKPRSTHGRKANASASVSVSASV